MPLRAVLAFWETAGCTRKMAGCPKQFPTGFYVFGSNIAGCSCYAS